MITSQPIATQTGCQNTPPSMLSVSASGTGLQYQWYVDGDNVGFNGSSIMGATSSTYMPPTTIPGSNYYYASVTGACGAINTQYAEVNVNANGRWLGTVSADWHNPSNWCGGVPDMTTEVVIAPAPFHPIVSNANAICKKLTLLPTAVIEVNSPRELRLMGN